MQHDNPLISIIMPVYNCDAFLAESIESLVTQTFTDWELIIIDDSSTDTSRAIAQHYALQDNRIKVFSNTHEKGLAGALNCALSHVRGTYIARADGDDINVPTRLEIEYRYLEAHSHIDIVGSWYETFGNEKPPKVRKHPSRSISIAWKYLSNTYFCHPTILLRKKVLDTVPEYPLVVCEDFAFLSQAIHVHQGHNIPKVLLHYREHANNYSSTKAAVIRESVFETYKKNYAFYGGTPALIDAFYQFHGQYRLSFKTILPLLKQSLRIGKHILTQYGLQKNIWAHIILYSTIKLHFLKAVAYSMVCSLRGR
jgi:glycosyltransferase involved in cell wall biosynthesis